MGRSDEVIIGTLPAGTVVDSIDGIFVFRPLEGDPFYFVLTTAFDFSGNSLGFESHKVVIPTPEALKPFAKR